MLSEVQIVGGINKQVTPTGAQGKWIDCDNVRFRYGYPEKIGGWEQTTSSTLVGVGRDMHIWSDLTGKRYIAIGTNKGLFIYHDGSMYDVSPLDTNITSCTLTTTNNSATVTVNKAAHGLQIGDLFLFSSVTLPGGSTGFVGADFTQNTFEVITRTSDTFPVTAGKVESGSGFTAGGSVTLSPYFKVGDAVQVTGYGFGSGLYGGTNPSITSTTLNGALLDDANGTGGSGTTITLTSVSGFSSSGGTLKVGEELITYTGVAGSTVTGVSRGASGSTRSAHSDGAVVQEASNFTGWGDASPTGEVTLEPGNWSLDNFGQILVATVKNNKTFQWNPSSASALSTRATVITNAPIQSVMTVVSDRDRHLIHLGTETTVGTNCGNEFTRQNVYTFFRSRKFWRLHTNVCKYSRYF